MRVALAVAAAALAVWIGVSLFLFVWPREDEPGRADAVVVLAGARSRLDTGLRLMGEGVAPTLVISQEPGDRWLRARRLCEVRGRKAFRVLCFHARPYSTQGEAETVARIARQRGWRRLVVVTSTFHVTRARMLFRRCTSADVRAVGSRPSLAASLQNVPAESGKLLYQLTVDRGC